MDLGKLIGSYVLCHEESMAGNIMTGTISMKEKINFEKLFPSYKKLILENLPLQAKFIEQPEKNDFYWGAFSQLELESFLEFERVHISDKYDIKTVLSQYYPTNTHLPFYIRPVNEYTLIFCMNHAVAAGRALIYWINKWLQYYVKEANVVLPRQESDNNSNSPKPIGIFKKSEAIFWAIVYFNNIKKKMKEYGLTAENSLANTVELSYGKKYERSNDYCIKLYNFNEEETSKIIKKSKLKGTTMTEYITVKLAQGFLQSQPNKKRILMSTPMDITSLIRYSPDTSIGDYVGNLIIQIYRNGKTIEEQVKSEFNWFKKKAPLGINYLASWRCNTYEKIKTFFSKSSMTGKFTFSYSNVGVIKYPLMEQLVETAYFGGIAPCILITSATVGGKFCVQISVLNKFYNPDEVFSITNKIFSIDNLAGLE